MIELVVVIVAILIYFPYLCLTLNDVSGMQYQYHTDGGIASNQVIARSEFKVHRQIYTE